MRQKTQRGPSFRGAAGLLLFAAACAQVLNADGIVIVGGEPGPTPDVPAGPPPACEQRQVQCVGAALQICREDRSGFRTARVCSSAQLCCDDPSVCPGRLGCQPPRCAPGDFKCEGRTLEVCNDGQTDWTPITTCPSAAQCNANLGRCDDQACNPSTPDRQCSGGELFQCGSSGWSPLGDCTTRALCDTAASDCRLTGCLDFRGDPPVQVPSPFRCDNGDLFRCNDQQTEFEFVETCLNLFHCSDLRDVTGDPQAANLALADLERLGCSAPACIPGKYQCDGSRLMRCNPRRTGYMMVEDCGTSGRCNASAGSCSAQDCVENTTQCSGREVQVCTAAHAWQPREVCTGTDQCDGGACRPAVCAVTEYRCDGAALQRCNVDGTDWIGIHTCDTAALCNSAAKRCDPPVCSAGALRCSRDGKLESCAPGRNAWLTVSDCRAQAQIPETASPEQISGSCDLTGGGRCNNPPSCSAGSTRCNGPYLERCRDNTWQPQERCATSALCDASGMGSCTSPTCTPGKYRCVIPGATLTVAEPDSTLQGLTLQVCDASGAAYTNVRDCAANLCDAVHGQCDLCQALAPLCFGPSLYLCSADGQERELEKTCLRGCRVPPTGAADGDAESNRPACQEDLDMPSVGVGN